MHLLHDRYEATAKRLQSQLDELMRAIEKRIADGEPVTVSWLIKEDRYRSLIQQAQAQAARYGNEVAPSVGTTVSAAGQAAARDAEQLVKVGMGTPPPGVNAGFDRLPTAAIDKIVGATSAPGRGIKTSPLRRLLVNIGDDLADTLAEGLQRGIAEGLNPRVIARDMSRHVENLPVARARTIARSEVMRTYRAVQSESWDANPEIVKGWTWQSKLSGCCSGCMAMHGTTHPRGEILVGHPNCRCVALPITATWAELGFPGIDNIDPLDPTAMQRDAVRTFSTMTKAEATVRFGAGKAAAMKDGTLTLSDMVVTRRSKTWGDAPSQATLTEALVAAQRRRRR